MSKFIYFLFVLEIKYACKYKSNTENLNIETDKAQ